MLMVLPPQIMRELGLLLDLDALRGSPKTFQNLCQNSTYV